MASFCSGCGFPQAANSTFCPNCGARQQAAAASSPAPPPMQPVAAAPVKAGSGLKIVLVLLCVLAVGGIAMVGGMFYLAHRVKAAVVDKAKALGVDLPKDMSSISTSSSTPVRIPKACDVLSNQEVSNLLGEPIVRSQPRDKMCMYFGPPGLSATLAQQNMDATMKKAEAPGATPDPGQITSAMDQLTNTIGAQQDMTDTGGEMPLLMLIIDGDGKAQMTAMTIANGLFGGIANAAGAPKGTGVFAEIPGLGDRAVRMPKLGLNVLKGDLVMRIIAGAVPDSDNKTIAIARTVLGRL